MERRAFRVNLRLLELAREMRHEQVPAERKLWRCLRDRQLGGFKFRRQAPVDQYVADFYCPECQLIVELDGDSHFQPGSDAKDEKRTAALTELGYAVVRYSNPDIFDNLDGVLAALLRECETRKHAGRPT